PALARAGEPLPRERGEAFHRMMQRIDLTLPPDVAVAACAKALVAAGELRHEHVDAQLLADCIALLTSDLGQRLLRARRVWRELPFLQRLSVGDTFAVVQGVMDCLADEGGRWLLLDYKTDRIRVEDVPQQAAEYAAQVAVYRAAAEAALGQPVEAYLYFVRPRMAVAAPAVDVHALFAQL
ncbi:MAG: PD-(D/E)XK nuclease family protein, partial [Alicyclobacillus sp.]|nr:PD-(D/E)XK nuclease family protein [Alicyclobacillus sp.]